jgi:WG containing repeat
VKNAFLLLALLAFSFVLKAQTDTSIHIKIDSFVRGGDSVRYTIRGVDDTIQVTKLFRSGRIRQIDWKTDSTYSYNVLGHFEGITYSPNEDTTTHIDFYSNGQIISKRTYSSKGSTEELYEQNGQLIEIEKSENFNDRRLSRTTDKNGRIKNAVGSYTLGLTFNNNDSIRRYDTLFYSNGKPKSIEISNGISESYGKKSFKKDGTLAKDEAPEYEKLIVFKDNLDCFYGLKTVKGDTIVKPRYDRIDAIEGYFLEVTEGQKRSIIYLKGYFWMVTEGQKRSIIYLNGLLVKKRTTDVSDLALLENIDVSKDTEEDSPADKPAYFSYSDDGKMGVINDTGAIVLPPQYFNIGSKCLDDGKYFQFSTSGSKGYRKGYMDRTGKPLFDKQFNNVFCAYNADYFFLNNDEELNYEDNDEGCKYSDGGGGYITFSLFRDASKALFGLGKSDGTVLLKPQFCAIYATISDLFIAATEIKSKNSVLEELPDMSIESDRKVAKTVNHGMYDAHSRRWIVPQKGFLVSNLRWLRASEAAYLEIKDLKRGKYGMMDFKGKFVLPIEYDSIYGNLVIKDGKYQLFQYENDTVVFSPNKYDFLDFFGYHNDGRSGTDIHYIVAKKDGKWGVIDEQERIIKPFEFDYASVYGGYDGDILLVKKDRAYPYDFESLPNEKESYDHIHNYSTADQLGEYPTADDPNHIIFINNTGKVVIPPQYKVLQKDYTSVILLEDDKKQKKILDLHTGKMIDFPFDYNVEHFDKNKPLIVVRNKKDKTLGLVSKDGKIIAPCHHYGMMVSDDSPVFFAKKDAPLIKQFKEKIDICKDTLSIEDLGWKMYDFQGKLLNKTDFNVPISFYKGVGIGMQNRILNLYKADGTLLRPFNTEGVLIDKNLVFDNIRITKGSLHYVFYYRQGLNILMMVTKPNGEIIVNGGRYESISPFYGKYALVRIDSKIGLIDWSGKEIIAPQDLRTYKDQFVDSLHITDTLRYTKQELEYLKFEALPINFEIYNDGDKFTNPDKLNISSSEKAALWNLMLEQCVSLMDGTQKEISRPKAYKSAEYFSESSCSYAQKTNDYFVGIGSTYIDKNMASILLKKRKINDDNYGAFLNFHYQNDRWKDLKLNDLLYLQSEKRQKLNNIVAQKIKNLQDAFIDCSDPSNFLKQVEDKWLVNKEGVSFYFDSRKDSFTRSKIVLLTWEELSPFLKIKIKD